MKERMLERLRFDDGDGGGGDDKSTDTTTTDTATTDDKSATELKAERAARAKAEKELAKLRKDQDARDRKERTDIENAEADKVKAETERVAAVERAEAAEKRLDKSVVRAAFQAKNPKKADLFELLRIPADVFDVKDGALTTKGQTALDAFVKVHKDLFHEPGYESGHQGAGGDRHKSGDKGKGKGWFGELRKQFKQQG